MGLRTELRFLVPAPQTLDYDFFRRPHIADDKAVIQAYVFSVKDTSEADCVAALIEMYQELMEEK